MARAAKAKAPPPQDKVEVFEDLEQGGDDWLRARLGIITASNFGVMMRSGKDGGESETRGDLMDTLAGERMTGEPAEEGYKSAAMRRGNEMEPEARAHYGRTNFATMRRVGFIKRTLSNGIVIGCSPDSLVGDDGALEIKTMKPRLLIAHMRSNPGAPPPKHRAQLQGICWVAGLQWVDLMLFYRGMPIAPKWRVERDNIYIRELSDAVEVFDYELGRLVERIRSMGR